MAGDGGSSQSGVLQTTVAPAFNRHRLSQIVLPRLAQISPLKNCRKH